MSNQYPGGFITKSPVAPTSSAASGMWTLDQAMQNKQAGTWPVPQVIGQVAYTTPGTYSWVAPSGVTSVSVVAVGGGAMGGGGLGYRNNFTVTPGNSYTVVVGVGKSSQGNSSADKAGNSYFNGAGTAIGYGGSPSGFNFGGGGSYGGDGGGNGGSGNGDFYRMGGGGAGGYSGNGGNNGNPNGTNGSGGGGGGGGMGSEGWTYAGSIDYLRVGAGGAGGGVGLLGLGSSGAGGTGGSSGSGGGGGGGGSSGNTGASGGSSSNGPGGGVPGNGASGALYGGGAGQPGFFETYQYCCTINTGAGTAGIGSNGAVRIIWPGTTRSFPSTNTGNL